MPRSITPFLMFEGIAEKAMEFYTSLFPNSAITKIERYGPMGPGAEGSVKLATFTLSGREYHCIDSPMKHGFTFTPSFSLFVECTSEAELDSAYASLAAEGKILMPPGNYGFSDKFTWINDRFGVSWQLNYAKG